MSNGGGDYFNKALEWFQKTSPHTMLTILIVTGLALFLPNCWLQWAHLEAFRNEHLAWIWIAFALSGVSFVTLPFFGPNAIQKRIFARAQAKRRLRNLASDEQDVLRDFVHENVSAHQFVTTQTAVSSLEADGILTVAQPSTAITQRMGVFYYRIKPWMLRYLKKHPQFVGATLPQQKKHWWKWW